MTVVVLRWSTVVVNFPAALLLLCLLVWVTAEAFHPVSTKVSSSHEHPRRRRQLPILTHSSSFTAIRGDGRGGEPWSGSTSAQTSYTTQSTSSGIADIDEITDFASRNGIDLKFTTRGLLGGYRCTGSSMADPETVVGYVEGFLRPGGTILHADKMEIGKSASHSLARRRNGGGGGTFLGPGLLLAYVCFLHGRECGCKHAEFLAIDDAEFQHQRLIRYYKMMGFREVRYVGEELKDIPDRLVWGGCGTLMTENIDDILTKWTRIIRRSDNKRGKNDV